MTNRHDYRTSVPSLTEVVLRFNGLDRPIMLLEGTRRLPDADRPLLVALGVLLAQRLPQTVFRTGGADGSDAAFAEGVCSVDFRRLEYVLPHAGHRTRKRHADSPAYAFETLGLAREQAVLACTAEASPSYKGLVDMYGAGRRSGALAAKTRYLLRDTLKVSGCAEIALTPANTAIFYINEADPLGGGTGHTLRVCHHLGVPVYVQSQWRKWIENAG